MLVNVKHGQEVELVFKSHPGRLFHGKVDSILGATGEGQGAVSGTLPSASKIGSPQNQWVKKLEMAPLQHVGFFALLKKQADMHERSQGLPKQPLACFLTPVALELVPTSARSSTEAT